MSFAFMPLYTGDYLRDTQHLSCSEHGIFVKLLMYCWDQKGPAPLDERKLCGIVNARSGDEIEAMRRVLGEFFIRMDDGHYNKRMSEEVAKAERFAEASRRGGLASAEAKRTKARTGAAAKKQAPLEGQQMDASRPLQGPLVPSPSPSPPHSSLSPPPPQLAPSARSGKPAQKRAVKPVTMEVWDAYRQAYSERYSVEPVRNAKVNAQLAQLVERLGADEAPGVARFYVSNRNSLYINAKHCTDLLLRDAEKLRTEWATGNVTHRRDAAEEDRIGATGAMWDRIGVRLKEKGIE